MNMPKFAKTKKFVDENRTILAFSAGVMVTSVSVCAMIGTGGLLKVTQNHLKLLSEGSAIVYNLGGQELHLINVPAVEAAVAAL